MAIEFIDQEYKSEDLFKFIVDGKEMSFPKTQKIKVDGVEMDINVNAAIGNAISKERSKAKESSDSKLKRIMEEYESTKMTAEELRQRLNAVEEEKISIMKPAERDKAEMERAIKKAEELQKKLDEKTKKWYDTEYTNKVLQELGKLPNLRDAKQAAVLLNAMGKPDVKETQDGLDIKFMLNYNGTTDILTVEDAVKHWSESPDNSHHFNSTFNGGSGSQAGQGKIKGNVYTRDQLKDAKVANEYIQRKQAGESVSVL